MNAIMSRSGVNRKSLGRGGRTGQILDRCDLSRTTQDNPLIYAACGPLILADQRATREPQAALISGSFQPSDPVINCRAPSPLHFFPGALQHPRL